MRQCSTCGAWYYGEYHACSPVQGTYYYPPILNFYPLLPVLERIATALEKLSRETEKDKQANA
jgi:hypothetical protein